MSLSVPRGLRHRRSILSGISGFAARALGVLASIIAVPILLEELGEERYGLFATATSIALALGFADLGIGNGLVTTVASAAENDREDEARVLTSTGAVVLSIVALSSFAVGSVVVAVVNWPLLFNLSENIPKAEAGAAVWTALLVFCMALPMSVAQKTQMALQEGYQNGIWLSAGHLVSLFAVVAAVSLGQTTPVAIGSWLAGPAIAYAGQYAWLFTRVRPRLRPRVDSARLGAARRLLRLGSSYFVLQLAFALAFTSDNVVAAATLGPASVTTYAVHAQPFIWITGTATVFLLPLWPAYTAAIGTLDLAWVRLTFRRSVLLSAAGATSLSLILVAFGPTLMRWWVGDAVEADRGLISILGILSVAMVTGSSISMLLNAAEMMRFQLLTATLMGVVAVSAKAFGAFNFGLRGMVTGTLLAYVVVSLLPTGLYLRRWLRSDLGAETQWPVKR